jgi:non-specific serine/threonine protein kinase
MRAAYEEALQIARQIGSRPLLARALFDLSFAAMVEEDFDGHERLLRESLVEENGTDPALTGQIWRSLGFLEVFRGNVTAGFEPIERSIAIHRELGNRIFLAEDLTGLGAMKALTGDIESAEDLLKEAVLLEAETENPMTMVGTLFLLAVAAVHHDRHRRAASLLGASARIRDDLGGGPPAVVTAQHKPDSDARQALGDEEYERARAEGYAMTLDEAVAFALEEWS